MESFYREFFQSIYLKGSLLGFLLLLYSTAVSILCIAKKKFEPQKLSPMETTSFAHIVEAVALPTVVWELAYATAYTSLFSGFFIWIIAVVVLVLIVKTAGFNILAGVHSLLSGVAMVVGIYLTLKTHPF